LDYLGKLQAVVSDIVGPYIILGDFNCNPNDKNSPCGKVLRDFIDDCDFALYDRCLPVDSYTFVNDAWHTTSWLDHCIGPRLLLGLVDHCEILYDSYNSDHHPFVVSVLMPDCNSVPSSVGCDELCITCCSKLPKIVLNKVSPASVKLLQASILGYLQDINLSKFDVLCCINAACDNSLHRTEIEELYSHLTTCLVNAVNSSLTCHTSPSEGQKVMPGWNEYVLDVKEAASDAYVLWHQ